MKTFCPPQLFRWLALVVVLLPAGCTVGPDFKKPAAPSVTSYTSEPVTLTNATTSGDSQRLVSGQDISGECWKLFHSQSLNDLIERSLRANPNLKAAQATLAIAHENILAQKGGYYPSVAGGFSAARQKTSSQISPTPNSGALYYNLFTPQVSVSYTPDVFGLNRRSVESLKAQEAQTRFTLIATHITLSANVVAAAIQEASLREQIAATHELIAINTNMLQILRNQLAQGSASQLDVAAQESQLAQVTATLPPLLTQLAQQRDLLSVLAGEFPGKGLSEKFDLSSLQLPRELPLSLPSQLVEQRPDVRQAEENLHAASAQVGIAVANRLPNLTLTADAGTMALQAGQMFAGGAGFWTLAGNVTQPIFQGGMLLHRQRAAQAAFVQAAEQYRSAVLTAFQNVADTLNALEQNANALNAAVNAKTAAETTLEITRRQLQSGSANYLAVLSAEQTYQQAIISLVQAQANRYADTAALFQALGGGWWNRTEFAKNPNGGN
jgi:NodT family efflux transporter outer membrane factor (OMF) lipoprotein